MLRDGTIGILRLKTGFRRFVGDIGNEATWGFPVRYRVVEEARATDITALHRLDLLETFKRAADELIAAGVVGITTTCGFLSIYQRELADHCSVPVATSSLLQIPSIERLLPRGRRAGILTFDAAGLTERYLEGAGVRPDTPVVGMPGDSGFVRWIKADDDSVPFAQLRDEVVAAAVRLTRTHPDLGAIVCECTNLAPFSRAIHERLGLPVFDAVTMVNWFRSSLCPTAYPAPP